MRDGNNIDTPSQGLAYRSSSKYGMSGMGIASMRMRMKSRGVGGGSGSSSGGSGGGREISERKQVGDAEEMVNLEKERRDGRSAGDWED